MSDITGPFYPIIYVRGYAMTQGEIDDTVSTPYMGFNQGATKIRQNWQGTIEKHIFESPLVRLMKDYGYQDNYHSRSDKGNKKLPAKSVIIYRYYDQADTDFGNCDAPSIAQAAQGLHDLILKTKQDVCGGDQVAQAQFKVYLVAHSMGGLICRALLQNPNIGSVESTKLVDKVFTYGTPHNGIDMGGFNVPRLLGLWDINNFNRDNMAEYLGLPNNANKVNSLNGSFDPKRFFCLIGTNYKDYSAGAGMSRRLAGEMSDGLVKISNAVVAGSPRAYVHRSHSGHYGLVNSEEGYQNLIRFLFGDYKVEGYIDVEALPLPPSVRSAHKKGKDIKASYYFEISVSPRGALQYTLTERRKETFSAVIRKFDELLRVDNIHGLNSPRSPYMFSILLDSKKITSGRSLKFSADLAVSTTDYEIDRFLIPDRSIPSEYLFRDNLVVTLTPTVDGPKIRYRFSDDSWGESTGLDVSKDDKGLFIPMTSKKGFRAKLRLIVSRWS
jgi:hypothetical protein